MFDYLRKFMTSDPQQAGSGANESSGAPEPSANAQAQGQPGVEAAAQGLTYEDLTQKLVDAQAKAAEHYDAFVRARAEMENVRKRAQEDVSMYPRSRVCARGSKRRCDNWWQRSARTNC
jgi:molecular chaperone GrpE (heat shock protein)